MAQRNFLVDDECQTPVRLSVSRCRTSRGGGSHSADAAPRLCNRCVCVSVHACARNWQREGTVQIIPLPRNAHRHTHYSCSHICISSACCLNVRSRRASCFAPRRSTTVPRAQTAAGLHSPPSPSRVGRRLAPSQTSPGFA